MSEWIEIYSINKFMSVQAEMHQRLGHIEWRQGEQDFESGMSTMMYAIWFFNPRTLASKCKPFGTSTQLFGNTDPIEGYSCLPLMLMGIASKRDTYFEAAVQLFEKSRVDFQLVMKALRIGLISAPISDEEQHVFQVFIKMKIKDLIMEYGDLSNIINIIMRKYEGRIEDMDEMQSVWTEFIDTEEAQEQKMIFEEKQMELMAGFRPEFIRHATFGICKPARNFRQLLENLYLPDFDRELHLKFEKIFSQERMALLSAFDRFYQNKPAREKGFGRGWFGESKRHSQVRRMR